MSQVTAKVACNTKTMNNMGTSYEQVIVGFVADYAGGVNKEWATSTPSLNFSLTVTPSVAERFNIGEKFTVTFDKEEKDGDSAS